MFGICFLFKIVMFQGLSPADYNKKKELIADEIISRLESKLFPGLKSSILFKEVLFAENMCSVIS